MRILRFEDQGLGSILGRLFMETVLSRNNGG